MFDNYVYNENSLKNFQEDGLIKGFEMQTQITYYRGIPLSMVHDVIVEVDGKKELAFGRRRQQDIRLFQIKDQRFFHQQRIARFDHLQRRCEVALVGQTEADQVGTFFVKHLGIVLGQFI